MRDDHRLAEPGDLQLNEADGGGSISRLSSMAATICRTRRTVSFSTRAICTIDSPVVSRSKIRNR
jgi:hypothetical protein